MTDTTQQPPAASAPERFDVVVVGGGPVGACAAVLLARDSNLRICLLEPNRPAAPTGRIDARVVAVSRASERILAAAGAWKRILGPRVAPYERMRIWHERNQPYSMQALVFDAAEVGEPNLGYIAESRLLQAALLDELEACGGHIRAAGFRNLTIDPDWVTVETGTGSVQARLAIGADGAKSAVRQSVGLTADISDYEQTAIIATIETEKSHENTAWQRFMQHGTLAFLPVADGAVSIVWSADTALAQGLLAMAPAEFERELNRASDHVRGATRLVSDRYPFPLKRLGAHRYVAHRCALVGDAAHVVHPLAGQGVNLGFMDAAALAELIIEAAREREDPGALRVLRRYERWRKSDVAVMSTAVTAFDRFLAHGSGPVARLAQRGLGWVNRSPELKRFFVGRALGLSGDLPAAARH
jgi:2-octaprenylphenol hydroxylase